MTFFGIIFHIYISLRNMKYVEIMWVLQNEFSFCCVFIDQINEMYLELPVCFLCIHCLNGESLLPAGTSWEEDINYASEERSIVMILREKYKEINTAKIKTTGFRTD